MEIVLQSSKLVQIFRLSSATGAAILRSKGQSPGRTELRHKMVCNSRREYNRQLKVGVSTVLGTGKW